LFSGISTSFVGQGDLLWSFLQASESNNGNFLVADLGEVSVPEPTALMLFGIGLAGLGFVRKRKALK